MSEELPNLTLLIKLLKMTTSSHDAEALLAIRKANEQLAKFGGDWERLLRSRITIIGADPFSAIAEPPKREPKVRQPQYTRPTSDIVCTACGTVTSDVAAFCMQCGLDPRKHYPRISCTSCGYTQKDTGMRCQSCGKDPKQVIYITCINCGLGHVVKGSTSCYNCHEHPTIKVGPRTNQYSSYCYCCGIPVPSSAGFLFRKAAKWEVKCSPCYQSKAPEPARRAKLRPNVNSIFDDVGF
jgi:hypothetical protein